MSRKKLNDLVLQGEYKETKYGDMTLYIKDFVVGSEGYVYNPEEEITERVKVVDIIKRSDNPYWYDSAELSDIVCKCKKTYDYSGEFIEADDCYYVFLAS